MSDIPPLPDKTILLVEVGSTAHGTGIPGGEDHDELGVVVESADQVVGSNRDGGRPAQLYQRGDATLLHPAMLRPT